MQSEHLRLIWPSTSTKQDIIVNFNLHRLKEAQSTSQPATVVQTHLRHSNLERGKLPLERTWYHSCNLAAMIGAIIGIPISGLGSTKVLQLAQQQNLLVGLSTLCRRASLACDRDIPAVAAGWQKSGRRSPTSPTDPHLENAKTTWKKRPKILRPRPQSSESDLSWSSETKHRSAGNCNCQGALLGPSVAPPVLLRR